jgi:hypothetical protein
MQKARSRLGEIPPLSANEVTAKPISAANLKVGHHEIRNTRNNFAYPIIKRYLFHFPALFFALVCWWLLFYTLTSIHPNTVKNLVFHNSYLLFIFLFFFTHFFTWSFIFLNSRRGLILASFFTTWLFLKLQQVIFTFPLTMGLSLSWATAILAYEVWHKFHPSSSTLTNQTDI